jgi:hypothetical protein
VKTDDLVAMLARGAGAVDARVPRRRLVLSLLGGASIAVLLMATWLRVNPALDSYGQVPMFWVREAFCGAMAVGGLLAAQRLARPGGALAGVRWALVVPPVALWMLAAAALVAADAGARLDLVRGVSWTECSVNIAVLALPVFVAMLWWMKGLAPTRLRLSGAAAGLAAGAVGALVYTLHCPELAAPFLGIWYVLGMLLPAAAGALLGPFLLRW